MAHDVVDYPGLRDSQQVAERRDDDPPDRAAYRFMGKSITFDDVDQASKAFAAYLQAQGFAKGDRIALMMPNVPQYPVAVAGVLRAGCVVVNVNPLYTPRELEHQLKDSGATCVVIVENFATTLADERDDVDVRGRLAGDHPKQRGLADA